MQISRALAETRLRKRWKEQAETFPTFAHDIPLDLYLKRNVAAVMENGYLESYDRLPNWRP